MKFNEEKKNRIMMYLLEKIEQNVENPSQIVSEIFNVNRNTVHTYINELVENNIIKRVKRGIYELVNNTFDYYFKREADEIKSETEIYNLTLKKHIDNLPSNVKQIWEYSFSEMVNNVIDHSGAEGLFVSVSSNYIKTSVIISDDGVGIFEKIKKHFDLASLDDAICELFKGKLTTDKQNHSGEGIFFSSKLMDDFLIVSSDKIFTADKFDRSNVVDFTENNQTGTMVIMSLSNYSHKESKEVFDMYSDDNGGFTKTKVPLKNIFDTSPVSRSQAKRVLMRLDKFEEVIIDFEGIGWMGQGFAHQIFVLYKNQHPDIKIVPINMNEDVTKMYNHVINTKSDE